MLQNLNTQGQLAFNINQRILGEQTYAVTTGKINKSVLRNCFSLQSIKQNHQQIVRYGDKVRIVVTVNNVKLYLQSIPVSPMRSSKFSRYQEVSITTELNGNSIWVFEHVNPKVRFDSIGQQINTSEQVLIKHNATSQWLASQKINEVNQFGSEFQAFAKSILSINKTQNLFAEKAGHRSVENTLRGQGIQNSWKIVTGN